MGFYDKYLSYKDFNFEKFYDELTDIKLEYILRKDRITEIEYLALLSPLAEKHLEQMARKAHETTLRQFGKTIILYTPMYLSNYCTNKCLYCGFNSQNRIKRKQLSIIEVEDEAKAIAKTGLRHILILTGDAREITTPKYIEECIRVIKKHFTSISIEIYAMEQDEYECLISAGVEGITIYQETYNEDLYDKVHLSGPKKDYKYRLDSPERACRAGMRSVNIGALLGLDKWRREAFITGLHANYLQSNYPSTEVSISLPRLRPHVGDFRQKETVTGKNIVQVMTAFRLFMARAGITISTRESSEFRDNIIKLGVTKMSAGSVTSVGGHISDDGTKGQFDISDKRNVSQMRESIIELGYQPVFKDWQEI
jgi:2-iminoacetate synthase